MSYISTTKSLCNSQKIIVTNYLRQFFAENRLKMTNFLFVLVTIVYSLLKLCN